MKAKGIITYFKQRDENYSISFGEKDEKGKFIYYGGWGQAPDWMEKGVEADIEYTKNNGFNNITKIDMTEAFPKQAGELETTDSKATPQETENDEDYIKELGKTMRLCFEEAKKIVADFVPNEQYVPIEQVSDVARDIFKKYEWSD